MTLSIIQLIYRRDYLKKKHLSTRSPEILLEYRHTRNKVTKQIRSSKQEYFNNVTHKYRNNSKALWKELNRIQGSGKHESCIPTELSSNACFEWFCFYVG